MYLLGRYTIGIRIRWKIGIYLFILQVKQILAQDIGLERHASSRYDTAKENGYVDSSERNIQSNKVVNKALDKAIKWVMNARDSNFGWGQDTPHTIVALVLSEPSWFHESNKDAKLAAKNLELELILKLWKHKEMVLTKGLLALNIIAMIGLCQDPRSFHSKNLLVMMDHIRESVHFEEAFSLIASCMSGRKIKKYQLRKIINILRNDSVVHSLDTQSVALLALRCTEMHTRYNVSPYIRQGIDLLMREQAVDGSFASNLHSTAIALQVLIANGYGSTWNATKAQQYIVSHQRNSGSFGNIFDTNAVLPVLAGKSLLSMEISECHLIREIDVTYTEGMEYVKHNEEKVDSLLGKILLNDEFSKRNSKNENFLSEKQINQSTNNSETVTITYIIWIGNDADTRYAMNFTVPKYTPFLSIMKLAAEKDDNFEFAASKLSTGYYVHTLAGKYEKQSGFWFWLLYRLRKPPIIENKPSNSMVSPEGVIELRPNDGDYILFWYHQL